MRCSLWERKNMIAGVTCMSHAWIIQSSIAQASQGNCCREECCEKPVTGIHTRIQIIGNSFTFFCVHVHAYPFYGCCLFACSKVLIPDSIGCTLPAPCHKIDKILKCIYLNTTDYITWPDGSVIAIYLVYLTFSPPRQLNKDLNFETGKKPKNKSRKGKTCKEKANPGSGGKKPSKSATSFKATKASKGKPANKSKARKGKSISIPAVSPEPESQPAGKKPKRHRKAVAWAPMGRLRHVSSHACTIFVSS